MPVSGPLACGYRGAMSIPFGFGFPQGSGDDGPFNMNNLGQALQQLGQMMQSAQCGDGPVNWNIVEDVARKAVVAAGDPASRTVNARRRNRPLGSRTCGWTKRRHSPLQG